MFSIFCNKCERTKEKAKNMVEMYRNKSSEILQKRTKELEERVHMQQAHSTTHFCHYEQAFKNRHEVIKYLDEDRKIQQQTIEHLLAAFDATTTDEKIIEIVAAKDLLYAELKNKHDDLEASYKKSVDEYMKLKYGNND